MSSTNKTATIELSQFVGTDKPAWLTDYNGDMKKIDDAIKDIQTGDTSTSKEITALQNSLDALTTTVQGNTTAISTTNNNLDSSNKRITTLEEVTTDLSQQVTRNKDDIAELKEEVAINTKKNQFTSIKVANYTLTNLSSEAITIHIPSETLTVPESGYYDMSIDEVIAPFPSNVNIILREYCNGEDTGDYVFVFPTCDGATSRYTEQFIFRDRYYEKGDVLTIVTQFDKQSVETSVTIYGNDMRLIRRY